MIQALMLAGTALNVFGQLYSAKQTSDALFRTRQNLEGQLGLQDTLLGFEQQTSRREEAQFVGTQRANYAKSGVLLQGTPSEVMFDTMREFELDRIKNEYNTMVEKENIKFKMNELDSQRKSTWISSALNVGSTILGSKTGTNLLSGLMVK